MLTIFKLYSLHIMYIQSYSMYVHMYMHSTCVFWPIVQPHVFTCINTLHLKHTKIITYTVALNLHFTESFPYNIKNKQQHNIRSCVTDFLKIYHVRTYICTQLQISLYVYVYVATYKILRRFQAACMLTINFKIHNQLHNGMLRNFIFNTDICTYIHTHEVNFTSENLYATPETKTFKCLYVYTVNTVCMYIW